MKQYKSFLLFLLILFSLFILLDQKYPLKGGVGICPKSKLVNKYVNNKIANRLEIEKNTQSPEENKLTEIFNKISDSTISIDDLRNHTEEKLLEKINIYFNKKNTKAAQDLYTSSNRLSKAKNEYAKYSGGQYTLCEKDIIDDTTQTINIDHEKYKFFLKIKESKKNSVNLLNKLNKLEPVINYNKNILDDSIKKNNSKLAEAKTLESKLSSAKNKFFTDLSKTYKYVFGNYPSAGYGITGILEIKQVFKDPYKLFFSKYVWNESSINKLKKYFLYLLGRIPLIGYKRFGHQNKYIKGVIIVHTAFKYKEIKKYKINGVNVDVLVLDFADVTKTVDLYTDNTYLLERSYTWINIGKDNKNPTTSDDFKNRMYSSFSVLLNQGARAFSLRLTDTPEFGSLPSKEKFFTEKKIKYIKINNYIIQFLTWGGNVYYPTITKNFIHGYYYNCYMLKDDKIYTG
tara:strand:+ start:223 stop:1596 length:1374 start_codon:yes stop_codon:yes gene_type:complete